MKNFILAGLVMLTLSGIANAQTFVVHPDSGFAGQSQLGVTITGSGTHFKPTGNLSGYYNVDIDLRQSGTSAYHTTPGYIYNDTMMSATLYLPSSLTPGWYDMTIANRGDTVNPYSYSATNAFLVKAPQEKILYVSPSSAYQGQSITLSIVGQATHWSGVRVGVKLEMGSNSAIASSVTVNSATGLIAKIKIPGAAAAGQYSLYVSDSTTGNILDSLSPAFTVLAVPPPASITVHPDTGAASTTFQVTIAGQYTNFQPSGQISAYINVDLKSGMTSIWHTSPDSVLSTTSMTATLSLLDSLPAGTYDLEVSSPYSQPPYDYHTPFYVIPFSIILPERNSGQPLSIVPVKVHAGGAHFMVNMGGTVLDVTDVQLVHGQTSIPGQNISVANDTTLSADFSIPADAPMGSYSLRIVEPGTGRIILSKAVFTVEATGGVSDPGIPVADLAGFTVSPNPSNGPISFRFSLAKAEHVRLTISDALGKVVSTAWNGGLEPGAQKLEWTPTDQVAGTYFYELIAGETTLIGKISVRR